MSPTSGDRKASGRADLRAFAPHLVLAAVILLEVLFHAVRHEGDRALERTLARGTTEERVWAIYRLANRDGAIELDRGRVQQFLSAPDARARDLMFTPNLRRFGDARQRESRIAELAEGDEDARFRSEFIHVYGGRKSSSTSSTYWMTLADLERFLELDRRR